MVTGNFFIREGHLFGPGLDLATMASDGILGGDGVAGSASIGQGVTLNG